MICIIIIYVSSTVLFLTNLKNQRKGFRKIEKGKALSIPFCINRFHFLITLYLALNHLKNAAVPARGRPASSNPYAS